MNSYVTLDSTWAPPADELLWDDLSAVASRWLRCIDSATSHQDPVGEQHWDAEELFAQTVIGLQRAASQVDGVAGSLGVTAWGVDVGLLDNNSELLAPIQHYRAAIPEAAQHLLHRLGAQDLFTRTGVLPQQINTVFRIREIVDSAGAAAKSDGVSALLIPDLVVCATDRCPHRGAIDRQHYGPSFPSHRHLGHGLVECCRSRRLGLPARHGQRPV